MNVGRINILRARGEHVVQVRRSCARNRKTRQIVRMACARAHNPADIHIPGSRHEIKGESAVDRAGSVKNDVVQSAGVGGDRAVGGKSRGARERKNSHARARVRRPVQMNVGRINILRARGEHIVQVRRSRARNRKTRQIVRMACARAHNPADIHIAETGYEIKSIRAVDCTREIYIATRSISYRTYSAAGIYRDGCAERCRIT